MYEKDAVWVNVSGRSTRGNLDGRLFIVIYLFIIEFRFTNTSWPVSRCEGEQIVTDFQDQSATLWRPTGPERCFFGTSSQVLTLDPQDNEEDYASDDDEGRRPEDNDWEDDDPDESENGEEEDITPDGNTSRFNSLKVFLPQARKNE